MAAATQPAIVLQPGLGPSMFVGVFKTVAVNLFTTPLGWATIAMFIAGIGIDVARKRPRR